MQDEAAESADSKVTPSLAADALGDERGSTGSGTGQASFKLGWHDCVLAAERYKQARQSAEISDSAD